MGPAQTYQKLAPFDPAVSAQRQAHGKQDGDSDHSNVEVIATSTPVDENAREDRRPQKRKRKNVEEDDDIETRYMRHLAVQEDGDRDTSTTTRSGPGELKAVNHEIAQDLDVVDPEGNPQTVAIGEIKDRDVESEEPPRHETSASDRKDTDIEKASKTIFLGNISTSAVKSKAAKKTLMSHLTSFIPLLPQSDVQHAIESFRFRSTAFAESGMPRKAAFIKQELMDTTTKGTNAYVVYTTLLAAREAMKRLNGTIILDRHLRVDSVAHPAQQDHRRSVFVGNLSFVDDTTNIDAAKLVESNSKPRKGKEPGDVEEGLWRQFGKAGRVESVRVVRDKTTRVGKGFAYVQFVDANAVEKALSFNEKKFPPMLPRILRVTRAKSVTKAKMSDQRSRRSDLKPGLKGFAKEGFQKFPKESKSPSGRAKKLLGRAGAAQTVERHTGDMKGKRPTKSSNRRAQSFKKKAKQK